MCTLELPKETAARGEFLGDDGLELVGLDAGAAVLGGDLDTEDAQFAQLVVEVVGDDTSSRTTSWVAGTDLGCDEVPDHRAEVFVFLVVDGPLDQRLP